MARARIAVALFLALALVAASSIDAARVVPAGILTASWCSNCIWPSAQIILLPENAARGDCKLELDAPHLYDNVLKLHGAVQQASYLR